MASRLAKVTKAKPHAEGASATVERAIVGGQPVARKTARTADDDARLLDEAERLAWLAAPTIPSLVGVSRAASGRVVLTMELRQGEPLGVAAAGLDADGRLGLALRVARALGLTLDALERAGVAHGDVKPDNVVASKTRFSLVDFGLAGGAAATTIEGATPRYLAPEGRSGEILERRYLDRFAFGVTLAEVLVPGAYEATDPVATLERAQLTGALPDVVRALLSEAPLARPSPALVASIAGHAESAKDAAAMAEGAIRAAYLAAHRSALEEAARCETHRVDAACAPLIADRLAALASIRELRGDQRAGTEGCIFPLDASARGRFVAAVVGPAAASFPIGSLDDVSEAAFVDGLVKLAHRVPPAAWTFARISDALREGKETPRVDVPEDATALALAVSVPWPDRQVLDAAEARVRGGGGGEALALATIEALRRVGLIERAAWLGGHVGTPRALALAADAARRSGAAEVAAALARRATDSHDPRAIAIGEAVRARLSLDAGDAVAALAITDATTDPAAREVRALALAMTGDFGAAMRVAEAALADAAGDETRARLSGVVGFVAHGLGDTRAAYDAFARSAEAASRAGAAVEEATYLTGTAAAAADVGELRAALTASDRATALWGALARPKDAARALLARASALCLAGDRRGADEVAREASSLAARAGDPRAAAYAELVRADVAATEALAVAHADRAAALHSSPSADDELRIDARRVGVLNAATLARRDAQAGEDRSAIAARLEWWAARGEALLRGGVHLGRPDDVLAALLSLAARSAPMVARARAVSVGVSLAERAGNGSAARVFEDERRGLAATLIASAPATLAASVLALPWVRSATDAKAAAVSPVQALELSDLVSALARQETLRSLLRQALDALVTWTGVERGVLLMPAPDGRLVPRAARNLSRGDLRGEQLLLSQSLAKKAWDARLPVVAVDAAGEAPDTHASVHVLKLRSVLAVPLIAHGQVLGVAYLDDRARRGAFGEREIAWVKLVATISAIAIHGARDRAILRRSARRAERAEKSLAEALAAQRVELDLVREQVSVRAPRAFAEDIVGEAAVLEDALHVAARVAPSDVPVLVLGESGSGKELVARAMHRASPRSRARFVSENCGAIPEALLESTLFGHARGAFTGAVTSRVGLFELADKGTLFLDEIGEMSLPMQTKLLRVLQDGVVQPLGGGSARKVDVRVIAATHRDLRAMVKDGRFREDLFYRLCVVEVRLPALRERPSDVPLLVAHFLAAHGEARKVRVTPAALDVLTKYPWPGNVRQLENEIRRALVLGGDVLDVRDLSPELTTVRGQSPAASLSLELRVRLDALQDELIRAALRRSKGNRSKAAELLGVSRFGLQKMLKRIDIDPSDP